MEEEKEVSEELEREITRIKKEVGELDLNSTGEKGLYLSLELFDYSFKEIDKLRKEIADLKHQIYSMKRN
jgi:hypothetical protein